MGKMDKLGRLAGPVLILAAAGLAACSGSGPEYHVSSLRPSAQATVNNEGDSVVVEVFSDNGIGSAIVTLASGAWPETILIRFHLQGLEGLQFVYGDTVVKVSVNTQQQILESVIIGGAAEETIAEQSPYWMPVRFLDKQGAEVDTPVAGGVIEVGAPADFHAAEHPEFTINWIDFYR